MRMTKWWNKHVFGTDNGTQTQNKYAHESIKTDELMMNRTPNTWNIYELAILLMILAQFKANKILFACIFSVLNECRTVKWRIVNRYEQWRPFSVILMVSKPTYSPLFSLFNFTEHIIMVMDMEKWQLIFHNNNAIEINSVSKCDLYNANTLGIQSTRVIYWLNTNRLHVLVHENSTKIYLKSS